jgi:hypothetical protein
MVTKSIEEQEDHTEKRKDNTTKKEKERKKNRSTPVNSTITMNHNLYEPLLQAWPVSASEREMERAKEDM